MIRRPKRSYRRQYSRLTAMQQWACDWRTYRLSRKRKEGAE